jgi:antitoxin component YwqK of YwqJK toxin-antitoxin module
LISRGAYRDGKPHGKWEYYYDFGRLLRTCEYKDGKLHGKSVMYSERGRVSEESEYRENRLDGEYTRYDDKTGKVLLRQEYKEGRVVKVLEGAPVKR